MPEDRAKVLAYKIEQALACNECGTRREEYKDDHNAYYAEARRCLGCEKLSWAQHSWAEERTAAYGLKFRLVKGNPESSVRMPSNKPD